MKIIIGGRKKWALMGLFGWMGMEIPLVMAQGLQCEQASHGSDVAAVEQPGGEPLLGVSLGESLFHH